MKQIKYILLVSILIACDEGNKEFDASGIFEATEIIVSAEGTGKIINFDKQEGDILINEEHIGIIDTLQLSLKKEQLNYAMQGVKSRISSTETQLKALYSELQTAQNDQKRFSTLVEQKAANRKTLEDVEARIDVINSKITAQKEVLLNTNASLEAESMALGAQIKQLEDQIDKQTFTTPISGTMLEKYAEAGEFVATGKPLFMVASTQELYLRAYVAAPQLTEIKLGDTVKVYSDKGEEEYNEHKGVITWIADKAEFSPKSIQTREERSNLVYAVKIKVSNDGLIKIGMYGEVLF